MKSTQKLYTLGYGGSVEIAGTSVQVLSANINKTYNIPTLNPYYQPPTQNTKAVKAVMRAAKGTCSFSGQVSFELTNDTLDMLFESCQKTTDNIYKGFFAKDYSFSVEIHDGNECKKIVGCMWQSINIQCQPSSMVTCSISFMADNNGSESLNSESYEPSYYSSSVEYIPYWQTGSGNMLQCNLTIDRSITPVYLNNDKIAPTYLRPGLISVTLNATYYKTVSAPSSIKIGGYNIHFKGNTLFSEDFKMASMQDIGEKNYQWKSMPLEYTSPIFYMSSTV